MERIAWPDGRRFAFTVFDDTDEATLGNVGEVYALLRGLGLRTTKSVWPLRGEGIGRHGGATCEDPAYRDWVLQLQRDGFEIGFHLATYHSSPRREVERGLELFARWFGHYPRAMANHTGCAESIYWGAYRLSGLNRIAYNVLTGLRNRRRFRGHLDGDAYFWGDLCRRRITYCRNFVFRDIDTLKACPFMPYRDPERPYVNLWFASSDGRTVEEFVRCLDERAQDRLEEAGGACIVYTHFACGFQRERGFDPRFRRLVERLSRRNGWFVPVSTLLDHLRAVGGEHVITPAERRRLERKWLRERVKAAFVEGARAPREPGVPSWSHGRRRRTALAALGGKRTAE
jgi:hypothetical protein